MTGPELRALPEVDCPSGGGECCACLYMGRRLCSYPKEAHLDILVRVYMKWSADREQRGKERALIDELDRAQRTHPWLR